jgi:hypothetical protein
MGFGEGYKERDYNQGIDEGDYEVILGTPVDTNKGGYDMRIIPITIVGHENCYPKEWTWFDRPTDADNLAKWEKAMTKNADAFGVERGNFFASSWAGKRGFVHIGKDKEGKFMKVLWSVVNGEKKPVNTVNDGDFKDDMPDDSDIPF